MTAIILAIYLTVLVAINTACGPERCHSPHPPPCLIIQLSYITAICKVKHSAANADEKSKRCSGDKKKLEEPRDRNFLQGLSHCCKAEFRRA